MDNRNDQGVPVSIDEAARALFEHLARSTASQDGQDAPAAIDKVMEAVFDGKPPGEGDEPALQERQKLYAGLRNAYREWGAVYGDTHEGMIHWFREMERRLKPTAPKVEERRVVPHLRRHREGGQESRE